MSGTGQNNIFKNIVNYFYNEELNNVDNTFKCEKCVDKVKLEPKIYYDKFSKELKLEVLIGNKKMYRIKNLALFYTAMQNNDLCKYGNKLEFIHNEDAFRDESKEFLKFVLKYAEIIKFTNSSINNNFKQFASPFFENSIILTNSAIDELFDVLEGQKVSFQKDNTNYNIEFTNDLPDIKFKVKSLANNCYKMISNIDIYKINIISGKKYKYILDNFKMYRCTKEFENSILKMIEIYRKNYISELNLELKDLSDFFSIIIPKMEDIIDYKEIPSEIIEKYKAKKLIVKVFLDYDSNDYLIADVRFFYGNDEFNPLDNSGIINFPRNMIEETKAFSVFMKSGFMLDTKNYRFIIPDNDKIYNFITNDINYYLNNFEVMVTDSFRRKEIREPKIGNIGVKVENNLLSINLDSMEIDIDEIGDILKKYLLKKNYYRLKDGSFIDLKNNNDVIFLNRFVNGMDISLKELKKGNVMVPINRTLYLNQLLKELKSTPISTDSQYKNLVSKLDKNNLDENFDVPQELNAVLRYYQKIGFKWLKTLDYYKFGGILADDMGLRKNYTSIINNFRLCTKFTRKENKYCCLSKFLGFKLAK